MRIAGDDTSTVLEDTNTQHKIRLYGINSPEKKQAFGQRARQALAAMIAGKTVDVADMGHDRYGRTIGLIEYGGQNINRQMVRDGRAWVYRQYCKIPECRAWLEDEARARNEGLGLWFDKEPVPPWEWRKERRKN